MKNMFALLLTSLFLMSVFPFAVFATDDAKFELEINAPKYYLAGDSVNVTVSVKNITAENGLHVVRFKFLYDETKFVLQNDLDENDFNILLCVPALPAEWENLTKVSNNWSDEMEEGDTVTAKNDGVINASAGTSSISSSYAIKADGALVFSFDFVAKENASGDTAFEIVSETIEGAYQVSKGVEIYTGGSSKPSVTVLDEVEHDYIDVVTPPTCEDPGYTTHTCSKCGDEYTDTPTEPQHKAGEWATLEDGSQELRCSVCGELLDTKPAPEQPPVDPPVDPETKTYALGDINMDDTVNQYDYILAKRAHFNTITLNDNQKLLGDMDENGKNNQYDYILVKRIHFKNYSTDKTVEIEIG